MTEPRRKKIAKPRRNLTEADRSALRDKIMIDFAATFEYLRRMGD